MNERYRKELDRKSVSNDGFAKLSVVLDMLKRLLYAAPGEVAKIPLVGHCPKGGYYKMGYSDALEEARETLSDEWVRVATVRWVDLCLDGWERMISFHGPFPERSGTDFIDFEGVHIWVISENIRAHFVGSDCNRLSDRFLHILQNLRYRGIGDQYIPRMMGDIIARRTCTARPGDPHRDELTRDLLREHYGLK